MSLSDAESCIFEGFRLLSQKFLEIFLSHQANEEPREPVDCPECGEACRLVSVFGRYDNLSPLKSPYLIQ